MDKVTQDAVEAKQKGLTYGQLVALKYEQGVYGNNITKETAPEGWRKCEYCGKYFKKWKGKRFCDVYCRERGYAERKQLAKLQTDLDLE